MSSQQPSAPATTSATEELSRFGRYVESRTRNIRQAAAAYLGTSATDTESTPSTDEDNTTQPLFVDVEDPNDGWVGLTEEAADVPEVCIHPLAPIEVSLSAS